MHLSPFRVSLLRSLLRLERMEHSSAAAPHTGTTIVAVAYDGGVVLGADTRVTTGTYISNRTSDKIAELADHVFLCRSGSAADTQAVSDIGTAQWCPHVPLTAPCLPVASCC